MNFNHNLINNMGFISAAGGLATSQLVQYGLPWVAAGGLAIRQRYRSLRRRQELRRQARYSDESSKINYNLRRMGGSTKHVLSGLKGKISVKSSPMKIPNANIRRSRGLTIGRRRRHTKREQILRALYPSTICNCKWTFQMDCDSGRVTAAQIPILVDSMAQPYLDQLYTNQTTDTATADPTMLPYVNPNTTVSPTTLQYTTMIEYYRSSLKFYNSSTNTLRCRVVWYKPKRDMDSVYMAYGANSMNPLNFLMICSNSAQQNGGLTQSIGNGTIFDAVSTGSNYQADYNHAGWPVVPSATTTTANAANTVAHLDVSLVPGSPEIRRMFNHFWSTVSQEEFTMVPGSQYDTSVTLKNKVLRSVYEDRAVNFKKDSTVIGIVYVLGQVVFAGEVVTGTQTISTGSSQLSVIREDICQLRPVQKKRNTRVNLTGTFVPLADASQGIINVQTNEIDFDFAEDR